MVVEGLTECLGEWNAIREAVGSGDIERIQVTFDACEEWIDFAYQEATTLKKSQGHISDKEK